MASHRWQSTEEKEKLPSEALADLWSRGGELERHFARFLAAKLDRQKLRLRHAAVLAVLGAMGLVVVPGGILLGMWFAARGVAGGVTALLPAHPWVGDVVAGVLIMGGLAGGGVLAWKVYARAALKKTLSKYARSVPEEREGAGPQKEAEPHAG